jgi:hypothetical protein
MSRHAFNVLCCLLLTVSFARASETVVPAPPGEELLAQAKSFAADQAVVATHYFYWYKWPDEHFFTSAKHDRTLLRQHFPDAREVSYESVAWHRKQMTDLRAAGVDVALCIYWGTPANYDKADIRFSVRGLGPLAEALDELAKDGKPVPRIGMFYDTSTLLGEHAYRGGGPARVDLRTPEGKDIFYRTIRDFFCFVPPRHWACIDGRPIVQLYESAFAAGQDETLFAYVYEQFERDFHGRRPVIIAGPAWKARGDYATGWGAAIAGPIGESPAVQIGPGYDDSPVPGRTTPPRDRLGGGFYAAAWLLALQQRPKLVILETWDEMHEGTALCETLEDGRYYIELTRRYVDLLKAGRQPETAAWADTVKLLMNASGSNRFGREFAGALWLKVTAKAGGVTEEGLRLIRQEDGVFEVGEQDGTACVRTRPGVSAGRYLYFDVADPYYYDQRGALTVRVTYWDAGRTALGVEYDSTDTTGTLADRYKRVPQVIDRDDSGGWRTVTVKLPGARCANRQNGGADFRLAVEGTELVVRAVEVTKLPKDYAP